MKQVFDISEKVDNRTIRRDLWNKYTLNWEHSSWKYLSLVGDEEVISLLHTKVNVFSDSVLCLGKMNENPQTNICMGRQIDVVQKVHQNTELWAQIDGEPMEFE